MQEIKFRLLSVIGKIVGFEKWYSGCLDSKNFWVARPCWLYGTDNKNWSPKPIIHRHKDKYTGQTDKYGVEIYENDKIEFTVFDCMGDDTQYIGFVKFAGGEWQIWNSEEDEYYGSDGAFHLGWVCSQDDEIEIINLDDVKI